MSIVLTHLQDVRANHPSNLDRDELRIVDTGLLVSAMEMTDSPNSIITPDLKRLAEDSEGRALDVPVMKKGTITISNVRSCTVSCGESESDLVRIVWKTIVADICMVPSNYRNNEIGYTYDLGKKIRETVEAFRVEMESDIDAALDANKSQIYASTIVGDTYALTGSALQVTDASKELFFGDLTAINFADEFRDPTIKIIATHRVMPLVDNLYNQGAGNDKNLTYQFPGKDFRFSNAITNGAGKKATGYFMPDGSIGILTRVDGDAKAGHKSTSGTEWMEETLPGLPFPVGIKYDSACKDKNALQTTGTAHLTATLVEHYQISYDFAIVVPYNTDLAAKASSIRKFELV